MLVWCKTGWWLLRQLFANLNPLSSPPGFLGRELWTLFWEAGANLHSCSVTTLVTGFLQIYIYIFGQHARERAHAQVIAGALHIFLTIKTQSFFVGKQALSSTKYQPLHSRVEKALASTQFFTCPWSLAGVETLLRPETKQWKEIWSIGAALGS